MGSRSTITEWDIQALLDNELSADEELYVLKALEISPEMQERYNSLKKQKLLLQLWWKDH